MFIGEAPGADETVRANCSSAERRSRHHHGQQANGGNSTFQQHPPPRPPGNRTPSPQEAANCREFLDGQIEIVNPKYIVCWPCAAHNLRFDTKAAIGKMRRVLHHKDIKVLCTH